MKTAFFSTHSYDKEYFNKYNKEHQLVFFEAALEEQTTNLAAGCEAVCVFVNDKLNPIVLTQLARQGIKLIALRCAGYNNVNLTAAKENNIKVVRVPAYSPHAVAEHAVALMMTLNRKTHKAYNRVREGDFSLRKLTGFDLYGKTTGVIGTGKIGAAFAKIMTGFGCKVLAYDIYENEVLKQTGIEYTTLDSLLKSSDVVSLHCPLTDQTKHIINDASLSKMKHGAMLINTSRGALIDTKAAIQHLKSGQLGYLGIDVYEQEEKLFFNNLSGEVIQDDVIMRLMSFPNVLITAHQGFFTDEALTQIAQTTLNNVSAFEKGAPLLNEVK
ncbi:MAG: 2-hydroxyacid dehydrogenase [Sphingobacteriales bacterium]|nr:2-hydroxyacid dehydrogenase [Sphingobacteriales bacterium]